MNPTSSSKQDEHEESQSDVALKRLGKEAVVYGSLNTLNAGSSMIMFPILANEYSLAEFGIIDFYLLFSTFLASLMLFGNESALLRYFFSKSGHVWHVSIVSQAAACLAITTGLVTILLFLLMDDLHGYFLLDGNSDLILYVVLLSMLTACINFQLVTLRCTLKIKEYSFIVIASILAKISPTVFSAVVSHLSVEQLFQSIAFSTLIPLLAGLFFVKHWLKTVLSFDHVPELIRYALPIGLVTISTTFIPVIERHMILDQLGENSLGLYSSAAKVAFLASLFVGAVQTAWSTVSLRIHKSPQAKTTYMLALNIYMFLFSTLFFAIIFFGRDLMLLLISENMLGYYFVVGPLCLAIFAKGLAGFLGLGGILAFKPSIKLFSQLLLVFLIIVLSYSFGPIWGAMGVSVAIMLSTFLALAFETFLCKHYIDLKWPYRRVMLVVVGLSMFLVVENTVSLELGLIAKGAIYVLVMFLYVLFHYFIVMDGHGRLALKAFRDTYRPNNSAME